MVLNCFEGRKLFVKSWQLAVGSCWKFRMEVQVAPTHEAGLEDLKLCYSKNYYFFPMPSRAITSNTVKAK